MMSKNHIPPPTFERWQGVAPYLLTRLIRGSQSRYCTANFYCEKYIEVFEKNLSLMPFRAWWRCWNRTNDLPFLQISHSVLHSAKWL